MIPCVSVCVSLQTLPTTQYELEIVAQDMKGRDVGLTGTATATITITDKNDHAPEFTHSLVSTCTAACSPHPYSLSSVTWPLSSLLSKGG